MTPCFRFLFRVFFSLTLSLVGFTTVSFAQQCTIKSDQLPDAPELRGFRLGMTFDQVKAIVPQIKFGGADEIGVTKTTINPLYDPKFDKVAFADIRTISFDFLDGKLTTLGLATKVLSNGRRWMSSFAESASR